MLALLSVEQEDESHATYRQHRSDQNRKGHRVLPPGRGGWPPGITTAGSAPKANGSQNRTGSLQSFSVAPLQLTAWVAPRYNGPPCPTRAQHQTYLSLRQARRLL